MAIVANTFTSFSAKGIREELSDVINSISPETAPFKVMLDQKAYLILTSNGKLMR